MERNIEVARRVTKKKPDRLKLKKKYQNEEGGKQTQMLLMMFGVLLKLAR